MNGELYGAYNIVQSDTFESHSLCPVYLTQGTHRITLQTVKNSVSLDKITVKNTEKAADKRYSQAGTWISGKDVNTDRIELMDYLKSIYGRKTLTAQAVTPNTNTEIDAIVKNTGRFPAIRASDLRYYTASGAKLVKNNTDIQLSQEWAKNGGIVSYTWYWYTPIGKTTLYRDESTFDIGAAVSGYEDLAVMNEESLAQLLEDETISEECYAVLSDMDAIAKQLSVLKDSGVTVLSDRCLQAVRDCTGGKRTARLINGCGRLCTGDLTSCTGCQTCCGYTRRILTLRCSPVTIMSI